jgi:hypothetical protein
VAELTRPPLPESPTTALASRVGIEELVYARCTTAANTTERRFWNRLLVSNLVGFSDSLSPFSTDQIAKRYWAAVSRPTSSESPFDHRAQRTEEPRIHKIPSEMFWAGVR